MVAQRPLLLTIAMGLVATGLVVLGESRLSPAPQKASEPGASVESTVPAREESELLERSSHFPTLVPDTPEDVRAILRFCEAAGSEHVADLRRAALESPHPLVVGNALRALGRLGVVMGDSELLALMTDDQLRVRQDLVTALGVDGDLAAVEILSPLLELEPGLRPLVIQALGRLGGDEARAILTAVSPRDDTERAYLRTALR